MKTYLMFFVLFFPGLLNAQTLSHDSIMANERSIDRPITLHARQIRISAGYGLSIIAKRFDAEGESINLRDEGLASIRHRFVFDLKYGINDFIQFTAATAQSNHVVRDQTRYIFPPEPDPVVMQDIRTEYSGFEDLFLGLDLRAPFKTKKVDLAVTLGVNLPVAAFEPKKPEHTYELVDEGEYDMDKFTYHYYYPLGKGLAIAQVGGMVKYRTSQWAFSARLDYQHGLKDGESFDWRHQLDSNEEFEYRRDPFTYRLPDSFLYSAEAEYQPLPWFDIFMNLSGYNSSRGWSSAQEGLKVAMPDQSFFVVSPGFEIIVTPKLWLREKINFSIAGKSYEAPFGFQTSLIYNFFLF
jgi:hypothetical protein